MIAEGSAIQIFREMVSDVLLQLIGDLLGALADQLLNGNVGHDGIQHVGCGGNGSCVGWDRGLTQLGDQLPCFPFADVVDSVATGGGFHSFFKGFGI